MVRLWYGGTTKPVVLSWETFKRDSTGTWNVKVLNPHSIPKWLRPGVTFFLHAGGHHIVQATIRNSELIRGKPRLRAHHHVSVDVDRNKLLIRQVQFDHTSCLVGEQLVMVPIDHILKWGYRLPPTAWERIMEDDDDDLFESF